MQKLLSVVWAYYYAVGMHTLSMSSVTMTSGAMMKGVPHAAYTIHVSAGKIVIS